ncbi:aldehyde dehydrogenase (NAD+) [Bartonella apihabitans]|uniref:L-piperidine-6-carboxylate dehydrogenase n=1 Tax=Bartonella apihabitans TaxID=2750929 RepID=UPI0009C3A494|nr:aldehyde dehydrogenase (NAD+) [Bartonella apihabitans]
MAHSLNLAEETKKILESLGVSSSRYNNGDLTVVSPINGEIIANVVQSSATQTKETIEKAVKAFQTWRKVPAPRRGEFVRLLGEELRKFKNELGRLVSLEVGKIISEGLGEVQEMIDICDFAVGLSRQLYGLTMGSERSNHRLQEQWHPIGTVGVITAFNFPVAVWSWNSALAFVCGDSIIWKPSEKSPLTALAVQSIIERVIKQFGEASTDLAQLIIGDYTIGDTLVNDPRVDVISATGSTAMGRIVGQNVAKRFGRSILELGGNNAAIVTPSADLELALRAIAFGAIGTAGQRCTTLRRLIVHTSIYDSLISSLKKVYSSIKIGNPLEDGVLVGPLIDEKSFNNMENALKAAKKIGGVVYGGGRYIDEALQNAFYVHPALVEMPSQIGPMIEETFAPILYVIKYDNFDEAIALQNNVPQGLSSAIFTTDMREADHFLSALGSDCGIANVNMGSSGAEIGGAFGGEKQTGGGRESGSDAWKAYMRRQTNAINYGYEMPLAQGVKFDIQAH